MLEKFTLTLGLLLADILSILFQDTCPNLYTGSPTIDQIRLPGSFLLETPSLSLRGTPVKSNHKFARFELSIRKAISNSATAGNTLLPGTDQQQYACSCNTRQRGLLSFAIAKGVAGLGKAGGDGTGGSDKAGQQVPPEVYNALSYAGTAFLFTLSVPLILYGLNKLLNKIEDCFGCGPASRKEALMKNNSTTSSNGQNANVPESLRGTHHLQIGSVGNKFHEIVRDLNRGHEIKNCQLGYEQQQQSRQLVDKQVCSQSLTKSYSNRRLNQTDHANIALAEQSDSACDYDYTNNQAAMNLNPSPEPIIGQNSFESLTPIRPPGSAVGPCNLNQMLNLGSNLNYDIHPVDRSPRSCDVAPASHQ